MDEHTAVAQAQDYVDRCLVDWRREFPDMDLETEGLIARIQKISRYIDKILNETAAEFGLSLGEWELLGALRRVGPPYTLTPSQLAAALTVSPAAMTSRLDRLESRGLVERAPDPDDRRVVQVRLTDTGRTTWGDAVDVQAAKEQMVAASLDEVQKRELNDLLRRLMLTAEATVGPPPTRATLARGTLEG